MRGTGNWSRPPSAGVYSYGNRQEKCAAAAAAGQSGARHFDQSQRVMANVHDYGRVCRRGRTAVGAASRGNEKQNSTDGAGRAGGGGGRRGRAPPGRRGGGGGGRRRAGQH